MRGAHEFWLRERIAVDGDVDDRLRDKIRAKAGELVRTALEASPRPAPPPFRPQLYARLLGIPVILSRELTDWDALLVPAVDGHRILCNARLSQGRMSFSIAHEIGHLFFDGCTEERYFLRTRKRESYYKTDEALRLERACDIAAAEILMPQPWFERAVMRRGFSASAVPEIAQEFMVSLEATAMRLLETREEPCAVGFFEFAEKPSAGRSGGTRTSDTHETQAYRVRRVFRSAGFPFLFPTGKSVDCTSVIYRSSLQQQELAASETFSFRESTARLSVSAFPLHRNDVMAEPPCVCAVFKLPGTCLEGRPHANRERTV